ncbi:MAG: DNA/RNA nuclease SfsA [Clostridiales bacterium]|nr:DNA/RNA nuclease SfsA [Candidatus Apopatocola equi]
MEYANVTLGRFLSRPNRFVARVELNGEEVSVHVKNTGRCRELLVRDARVVLSIAEGDHRKTKYDLIAVYKEGTGLINMDSQAPNAAAKELLRRLYPDARIVPEQKCGASRFDFAVDTPEHRRWVEVKGCTLERSGRCFFPDAPTERGVKHLRELRRLAEEGEKATLLFLVQMKGAVSLAPNDETDPAFGRALREAAAAGVEILCYDCLVTERSMCADRPLPVLL